MPAKDNNNERQVQAEVIQKASTAMIKLGVEAVKKNPVKVVQFPILKFGIMYTKI